jgi:hypothetical protein
MDKLITNHCSMRFSSMSVILESLPVGQKVGIG